MWLMKRCGAAPCPSAALKRAADAFGASDYLLSRDDARRGAGTHAYLEDSPNALGDVCTAEAPRCGGQRLPVSVCRLLEQLTAGPALSLRHMDLEDPAPARSRRQRDFHETIEAAGTSECFVDGFWPVRRREDDHAFDGLEAIEVLQKRAYDPVGRLMGVITGAGNRVELIEEHHRRTVAVRPIECLLHLPLRFAVPLADYVGRAYVYETSTRLARERARQHRLARSRRSVKQNAARWPRSPGSERRGIANGEADHLELRPGVVLATDVGEGDGVFLSRGDRRFVDPARPPRPRALEDRLARASEDRKGAIDCNTRRPELQVDPSRRHVDDRAKQIEVSLQSSSVTDGERLGPRPQDRQD